MDHISQFIKPDSFSCFAELLKPDSSDIAMMLLLGEFFKDFYYGKNIALYREVYRYYWERGF